MNEENIRKNIMDSLTKLYPTYPISTHKGKCKNPYFVVKFNDSDKSVYNSLAIFQKLEVMAYIPGTSISNLDSILEKARENLKGICEYSGKCTSDYYDEDKEAFMKSYQFTFPRTID